MKLYNRSVNTVTNSTYLSTFTKPGSKIQIVSQLRITNRGNYSMCYDLSFRLVATCCMYSEFGMFVFRQMNGSLFSNFCYLFALEIVNLKT